MAQKVTPSGGDAIKSNDELMLGVAPCKAVYEESEGDDKTGAAFQRTLDARCKKAKAINDFYGMILLIVKDSPKYNSHLQLAILSDRRGFTNR